MNPHILKGKQCALVKDSQEKEVFQRSPFNIFFGLQTFLITFILWKLVWAKKIICYNPSYYSYEEKHTCQAKDGKWLVFGCYKTQGKQFTMFLTLLLQVH